MKRTLPWIVGGWLLCAVLSAAAQRADGQGTPAWELMRIETFSHAPNAEAPKDAVDSPPKFLYLRIQLRPGVAQPNLHQFRVTDRDGKKEVGEVYGWYEKDSLLVFESKSDWRDLRGLYLDGLAHREPLFAQVPPPDQGPKEPPKDGKKAPPSTRKKTPPSRSGGPGTRSGSGGGGGGSGAGGGSGSGGGAAPSGIRTIVGGGLTDVLPWNGVALYLSCGEEGGTGTIYQVDEAGLFLGAVPIPHVATGLAFHPARKLVAVMPRDGGRLVGIGERGKYDVILWKDPLLIHPVDVAAKSDIIVVADDFRHLLASTGISGEPSQERHRFDLRSLERPSMSVAVSLDGHVLYGSSKEPGIYRYPLVNLAAGRRPLLQNPGGVAADTATRQWAATQGPDEIVLFDGEKELSRMRLPQGASFYTNGTAASLGMLSFGPASSVVVAAQAVADPAGEVWFYRYETKDDGVRKLFSWKRERLWDFVVGPRMVWPRDTMPR